MTHRFPLRTLALALAVAALPWASAGAQGWDWSGDATAEFRFFPFSPSFTGQRTAHVSPALRIRPEFNYEWANGTDSFTFTPFVRLDAFDNRRTHFDIRELSWTHQGDSWSLLAGVGKVFWGVTESQHLVDVINQTDFVENIDGEQKLGQPMVNLTVTRNWGTLDLFVLPGFRERTFPGRKGRLRFPFRVDKSQTQYESSAEEKHIDFAARWSHTAGEWDIGLSHFYGTARDPVYLAGTDGAGDPVLIPRYDLIHQSGLDVQWTHDAWLGKLELISRDGQGERFTALTGGFEYTFYNVGSSAMDVGVIGEYLYDSRGEVFIAPFQDDIFVGSRLALNDVQSTDILAGVLFDRESGASFLNIEANRRLTNRWKLSGEVRAFLHIPATDPLISFGADDHAQLELSLFF